MSNGQQRQKNRIGSYSLAASAAGFLIVVFQPWLALDQVTILQNLSLKQVLLSFFEAALVGGIADWFAISALFRHPLGIHLPHTNIIARKKDSLADAVPRFLGSFVQEAKIAEELSKVDFVAKFLGFLDRDDLRENVQKWLRERASVALAATSQEQVRELLQTLFGYFALKIDPVPAVAALLQWAEKEKIDERVLEALADMFVREIDRKHDFLVDQLTPLIKKNTGWQGIFISSNTVDRFLTSMSDELRSFRKNPQHGLRRFVISSIHDYAKDLADPSPATFEKVKLRGFVAESFQNKDLLEKASLLLTGLVQRVAADLAVEESTLVSDFGFFVKALRDRVEADEAFRARANEGVARVLSAFLTQGQLVQALSGYAADQLKKTETKDFVTRVENAVSNELQFIRVNGSVVGGLVGIVLAFVTAAVALL